MEKQSQKNKKGDSQKKESQEKKYTDSCRSNASQCMDSAENSEESESTDCKD